jgi:hypothetical protein
MPKKSTSTGRWPKRLNVDQLHPEINLGISILILRKNSRDMKDMWTPDNGVVSD